jgi:hypothetical protein
MHSYFDVDVDIDEKLNDIKIVLKNMDFILNKKIFILILLYKILLSNNILFLFFYLN